MTRVAVLCLLTFVVIREASAVEVYRYWIEPCSGNPPAQSACDGGDPELARWALQAWQNAAKSGLQFEPADAVAGARIIVHWLANKPQLYGDTQTELVDGKHVWIVEVQPDLSQLGAQIDAAGRNDRLFRDAVVYLTCLHEIGHALELPHTDQFADIMYSFQYGGDILEYFSRYRRTLKVRADIRDHAGLSDGERKRVAGLFAPR